MTRDAVPSPTPARFATSFIVAIDSPYQILTSIVVPTRTMQTGFDSVAALHHSKTEWNRFHKKMETLPFARIPGS
jgi:hypothetical protein